ncbi:MAG: hypothetical protein OXI01_23225 [Albidovulum sp.]|nr:hypothetical protein [Albidovulum sp.]
MAKQVAIMGERMETKQAQYESAIDRLRADGAARETRLILAMAGMIALAVAFLAYWGGPPPSAFGNSTHNPVPAITDTGSSGSVENHG